MSIEYDVNDHIAVITINRPEARNAVNGEVATGIEAALDHMEADPDIWVGIIAGRGPVFCAGADLKEVASGSARLGTKKGGFAGLVQRRRTKPLIAACDGPALAGGTEIVLACDLVVVSTDARFGVA
ncbi:MAG: enoyl-CoA hydratase-related protein [Acidimicrobiales bacterium]